MSSATSRATASDSPPDSSGTSGMISSWSFRRTLLASIGGVALVTVAFFCPRFWLWPAAGMPLTEFISIQPEFHRAFHALHQLQNPWQRIDDPVNRVIEWRLLWPVVGHYLGFSPGVYFALPHLGCLAALGATALFVWRATRAALPAIVAAFLAATSSWFFVSTGWLGYFDSWLILGLLLAAFGRSRWTLSLTALVVPWIDERFILALPLCVAVRSIAVDRDAERERGEWLKDGAALLAGILPYLAVRLGAEFSGARATTHSYWTDRPFLPAPWLAMFWGGWNGFRIGWIVLLGAALAAFRARRHRIAIVVAAGTLGLNLLVADDLSRSVSVALPALLATVIAAWRHRRAQAARLLPLLALGNLVLPAQHIIAAPNTPVPWHAVAILGADAEFERAKNPPEFADPAVYTRRSMDHLQTRNLERALAAAEIAVRFDPDSARAIANRGIVLYVSGKPAEGMADLDRALQLGPELYDARMQRASFRQKSGDLGGALEDVREALRHVPADWPHRHDAEQFERALAAQVGR